eukprot:Lankesteria_metandrocarpae@DN862_c0_g1_i2.p1
MRLTRSLYTTATVCCSLLLLSKNSELVAAGRTPPYTPYTPRTPSPVLLPAPSPVYTPRTPPRTPPPRNEFNFYNTEMQNVTRGSSDPVTFHGDGTVPNDPDSYDGGIRIYGGDFSQAVVGPTAVWNVSGQQNTFLPKDQHAKMTPDKFQTKTK